MTRMISMEEAHKRVPMYAHHENSLKDGEESYHHSVYHNSRQNDDTFTGQNAQEKNLWYIAFLYQSVWTPHREYEAVQCNCLWRYFCHVSKS